MMKKIQEKSLGVTQEERHLHRNGWCELQQTSYWDYASWKTMCGIFQVLGGRAPTPCLPRILYSAKTSFKYELAIKSFSEKMLIEFIATRPVLHEMWKKVLQSKECNRRNSGPIQRNEELPKQEKWRYIKYTFPYFIQEVSTWNRSRKLTSRNCSERYWKAVERKSLGPLQHPSTPLLQHLPYGLSIARSLFFLPWLPSGSWPQVHRAHRASLSPCEQLSGWGTTGERVGRGSGGCAGPVPTGVRGSSKWTRTRVPSRKQKWKKPWEVRTDWVSLWKKWISTHQGPGTR